MFWLKSEQLNLHIHLFRFSNIYSIRDQATGTIYISSTYPSIIVYKNKKIKLKNPTFI